MAGAPSSNSRTSSTRRKGNHRAKIRASRQPYQWLGVGALTIGLGAALASGAGVADAQTGSGSSSGNAGSHDSSSHTKAGTGTKAHKHQKKDASGSDSGSPAASSTQSDGASSTGTDSTGSDSTAGTTDAAGKGRAGKHTKARITTNQNTTDTTKKAKQHQAAATADDGTSTSAADTAPAAGPVKPATSGTPAAAAKIQAVPVAAVSPTALAADDSSGPSTTTTATTPHATSSNPIVAAIQNALISFFTAPATIAQLTANGLAGPTAPTFLLNPIGAILYGFFRGVEDFAGLVPTTGTPTTTSDTGTGTVTGTLGFTVPAGGDLTYSVATNPLFGSVSIDSVGNYTYKSNILGSALAALGLNPTDSFTVTATNGVASTNETVTVPVTSAIDTPSTPSASNIVVNNVTGVVTGTVASTDPGGQALSYSVLTQPVGGTLDLNTTTGEFSYTPSTLARTVAETGVATDVFTVTATNGSFTSLPGIITVPISPLTNASPSTPTVVNQTVDAVTGVVTGTLTSTDPGGAAVTYSALTNPVGGSLNLNTTTGEFTYTPSTAARIVAITGLATDVFTVTASDGTYTSLPALITVPVTPATSATPGAPVSSTPNENLATGVVTGTLSATSPDGSAVTFSVVTNPVGGSLNLNTTTGEYTYTPSAAARLIADTGVATDVFTVTATSATGYTSLPGIITVPISPASNDAPSTPTASVNQNIYTGVVTGTISATSPDGSAVTYSIVTPTVGGSLTLNSTTGAYTYTPTATARTLANVTGGSTDLFTVSATNSVGNTSVNIITVPISAASNDTPSTPTASVNQNVASGVVTGTISATSPDGAAVTYSIVTPTVGGSLTLNSTTGAYTYTPTATARTLANVTGGSTDLFTVSATNSVGNTSVNIITVPISAANNDTPTGTYTSSYSNGKTTGTVTGSSPDGSAVTYSATALPGSITVDSTTGSYTYTFAYTTIPIIGTKVYSPGVVVFTITNSSGYFDTITVTMTT